MPEPAGNVNKNETGNCAIAHRSEQAVALPVRDFDQWPASDVGATAVKATRRPAHWSTPEGE